MCYKVIRQLLFLLEPELAHSVTFKVLNIANKLKLIKSRAKKAIIEPVEVMGLTFKNTVGISAGLDKNAEYVDVLAAMGFGFIEIGTVTPLAQPGRAKPRIIRIPEHQALINRMGFPNKGMFYVQEQLQKMKYNGVLGINIGKNAATPAEDAVRDYSTCLKGLYKYASYITINVSSPNTEGLRDLQFGQELVKLLSTLKEQQQVLAKQYDKYVPLVVKIAPDLMEQDIEQICKILLDCQVDGVIATNTAINRYDIAEHPKSKEQGGLSGKPLTQPATEIIAYLHKYLGGKIAIIAAGGIMTAEDARAKMSAGASLVQVYTGFIYNGPKLLQRILYQQSKSPK